ncbi:MAG: hypothetical protein MI757_05100, partial [Pirellulales bacterium]|nr:hypothetical protein [Pirellulales bacterium]
MPPYSRADEKKLVHSKRTNLLTNATMADAPKDMLTRKVKAQNSSRLGPIRLVVSIVVVSAVLLFGWWCVEHIYPWYRAAYPPRIDVADRDILFYGTPAYERAVAEFPLSMIQAREKAIASQEARPWDGLVGRHRMVVDDEYVFSDLCKVGISLSGYYVNARNGNV